MKDKDKTKVELIKNLKTLRKKREKSAANNITVRNLAEEKSMDSEEYLKILFDYAPDVYYISDLKGNFIDCNKEAEKLTGYKKEELIGKNFLKLKLLSLANIPKIGKLFDKDLRGLSTGTGEFILIRKNNTKVTVEISSYTVKIKKKTLALGIIRGITERKKAEQALQEAHDQLEDKVAQRTEELQNANLKLQGLDQMKSLFITSMSHELMTPLSLIIGFTDIMLQGISGEINPKQRRQLTLVKNNANHLHGLINDAIDVNKIDAGKIEIAIEEFDLSALSREIKDSFILAADKKGLALSFEAPPNLIIESDRTKVQQVLVNLLSNALKFTNRGEIKIKVIQKDTIVEVSVRDTGTGIKEEDMDKLFKSFSQIPNPGRIEEGTGLGLYLSKKNANLLGGDLIAESERGKGSVFTLTLSLKYKEGRV